MKNALLLLWFAAFFSLESSPQLVELRITSQDPSANSEFGRAVGVSGDYVIVGAGRDNTLGEGAGAAYIFRRTGPIWHQQAKLLPSDGGDLDRMGKAVSISGRNAIVGAFNDDGGRGPGAGSAYIFERGNTTWTEKAKLISSDGEPFDQFGYSVSISGDYAIVGAFLDDNLEIDAGAAYTFHKEGGEWLEQAKLVAPDPSVGDQFGISVAIDGDYAVVGSSNDDDTGTNAGAAYVFRRDGTEWIQSAKLTAGDGLILDHFGESVAISGSYVLIGSRYRDDAGLNSGAAYVFHRTESGWIEEEKMVARDGDANDQFGVSVSLSGDNAVVGAIFDNDNGNKSGSAYLFRRNGPDWLQQRKITASDGQSGDWFGLAAAIDSQYTVIGKWADLDGGAAYVYSGYLSPVSVALDIDSLYNPVPAIGDTFPANLAITNLTLDTVGVDLWIVLGLPSGGQRPVFGPKSLNLGPSHDIDKQVIVRVPAQGPSGVYSLIAYWGAAGTYPSDTLGTEMHEFVKLAEVGLSSANQQHFGSSDEPQQFVLNQNSPNPFNPSTRLSFVLRHDGWTTLRVYDLLGREVVTLVDQYLAQGTHEIWWDGRNTSRESVSSGVYIYRLVSGRDVASRKLLFGK